MSQILDHDMDSLDLYMEVLRIVHHHPRSDASGVFTHATLAMDTSSCQNALDSLVHQGLVQVAGTHYSITASGIKTLIPVKRDGNFPEGVSQSYMDVIPIQTTIPTLHITTKNGECTITKDGVSLRLSQVEMQQLWKKLQREADHHA